MADLFNEIKASDYATKGIRVKNNPLGLSVSEAQRAFDELSIDVIIPKFNAAITVLNGLKLDERVSSGDIRGIRVNADGAIEITTDGTTWTATGSSGHIILDGSGTQYPQRSRLQFKNVTVTDSGTATVIEGIKGEKGNTGETGPQGATGPQGPKGDLGKAWLPNISSNGDLNWTQSDTTIAPSTVNIRGPQGVQGVQGIQGETGPQGAQGTQGPRGVQGVQGKQGEQGPTGATGASGPKGEKGETGAKGEKGNTGAQGPAGPQGATGPQGVQGPTGAQGFNGRDGADGRSFVIQDVYPTLAMLKNAIPEGDEYAYQVAENKEVYIWSETENDWVSLGRIVGPQGEQGPVGAQGVQGPSGTMTIKQVITGEPGTSASVVNEGSIENAELVITIPQGAQGEQGPTGATGPQGPQGEKGATGAQGPQGIQGIQGLQGEVGPQGPRGAQGPQGVSGSSAYQSAVNGGYTGTESDFNAALAIVPSQAKQQTWDNKVGSVNGKTGASITLTAADVKINGPGNTTYIFGIDDKGIYVQ